MSIETGIAIARWASSDQNLHLLQKIQEKDMNTDAIFGQIDPRDANMVALKDMFKESKAFDRIN